MLFIDEGAKSFDDLSLDTSIFSFIKAFINKKVFQDLPDNKSISLHNPITLDPDYILIIKVGKKIEDAQLYYFGEIISNFKKQNRVSIIWNIDKPFATTARTIQPDRTPLIS